MPSADSNGECDPGLTGRERAAEGGPAHATGRGTADPLRFLALPVGVADLELPVDDFPDEPAAFDGVRVLDPRAE